jgi:hypothetical protein
MPGQNDTGSPAGSAAAQRPSHAGPSRRSVLRGAAGAGVAGLAATTLAATSAPALAASGRAATRPAGRTRADSRGSRAAEPVVVHVRDAASGEIDVFRGTRQIRLLDPELAGRLVRASQ